MRNFLFLLIVASLMSACGKKKFDINTIEKLDNVYANNSILMVTVLKYNYNNGILDSISTDTVSVHEYGIRGNLKYVLDKGLSEYTKNSFKGTTLMESEIFNIKDNSLKNKVLYSYKKNILTEKLLDKDGNLVKTIIHHKDGLDRDTLYQVYSKENRLSAQYVDKFDNIGSKTMSCTDFETSEYSFVRNRVNDDPYNQHYEQKDNNNNSTVEYFNTYDKLGKKTEYKRVVYGSAGDTVTTHAKYHYLTEDGLLDKIVFYIEEDKPLYEHRYFYDKYNLK